MKKNSLRAGGSLAFASFVSWLIWAADDADAILKKRIEAEERNSEGASQ